MLLRSTRRHTITTRRASVLCRVHHWPVTGRSTCDGDLRITINCIRAHTTASARVYARALGVSRSANHRTSTDAQLYAVNCIALPHMGFINHTISFHFRKYGAGLHNILNFRYRLRLLSSPLSLTFSWTRTMDPIVVQSDSADESDGPDHESGRYQV